MVSLIYFKRC